MRLQLNTKDILFICGGAFVNLDRLVAERTSTASLGFGNPVGSHSLDYSPLTFFTCRQGIIPFAHTTLPTAIRANCRHSGLGVRAQARCRC